MLLEIEMRTRIRLGFIQHLCILKNKDAYCTLRKKGKVYFDFILYVVTYVSKHYTPKYIEQQLN